MAKDGTARGGQRVGSGRKSENFKAGLKGERLSNVIGLPVTPLSGGEIPAVKEYMTAEQNDGSPLGAAEIFSQLYLWLKEQGCEKIINQNLIEQYAMSQARLIQCENAISKYGFISQHPTTGAAIASPFVKMAQDYQKQLNQIWYQIYQVVHENTGGELGGAVTDPMEALLKNRRSKG